MPQILRAAISSFAFAVLAACGGEGSGGATEARGAANVDAPGAAPTTAAAAASASAHPDLAHRERELTSPTDTQMVLLYYNVAGLPPPIERWVENDTEMFMARGEEKGAARRRIATELQSAFRALDDVGLIRVTLATNLDQYDPTYSEFYVPVFSPSSVIPFQGSSLRTTQTERVSLKFTNGQLAQVWRVASEEAQSTIDRLPRGRFVNITALARVTGSQPDQYMNVITADVVEYEIRTQDGALIGNVRVGH